MYYLFICSTYVLFVRGTLEMFFFTISEGRTSPATDLFGDGVQGGNEELVTDQGQGVKHVDDADDVENDASLLQLGFSE